MPDKEIQFNDGAAYERYMGVWSRLAGEVFLQWLAPRLGLRWLDVGCGSGAFTEMIFDRCAPARVDGIDPSEAQLAFARERLAGKKSEFRKGDAMAQPFPDNSFDAAVMPLVIFFVPEPAKGVAEMARVVAPGGSVSAYAWDIPGGGFPYAALQAEMRALDIPVPMAPQPDAAKLEALHGLWTSAKLEAVETRVISVNRTYENFEDYWAIASKGPSVGPVLASLPPEKLATLKSRLRALLPADAQGRITLEGRANAVKGRKP